MSHTADQPWLPPGVDTSVHVARACRPCGGTRTTVDATGITNCPHCRGTGVEPTSLPPGAVFMLPPVGDAT